jgi:hypothetical protein
MVASVLQLVIILRLHLFYQYKLVASFHLQLVLHKYLDHTNSLASSYNLKADKISFTETDLSIS